MGLFLFSFFESLIDDDKDKGYFLIHIPFFFLR